MKMFCYYFDWFHYAMRYNVIEATWATLRCMCYASERQDYRAMIDEIENP